MNFKRTAWIAGQHQLVVAFGMLGVVGCSGKMAAAQRLRSPWDGVAVAATAVAYDCPKVPVFAKTIDPGTYYIDKQASVIDPAKLAAYQAATEAPTKLGQFAAAAADAYRTTGSRAAAECVYALLDAAAAADAWTGKMPDFSGVYTQDWELSGTGMAYLKVRASGFDTAGQETRIRRWFGLLAGRVREYFDPLIAQNIYINNHIYWAGLAVAAEGIAEDDRGAFAWGMRTYSIGVGAIQPDGSLVAEMDRGQRALHYHLYALGALVMLAELGEANGETMYAWDHGAIHRLVSFCVANQRDPALLEKRTGKVQVVPRPLEGLDVGWGVPYVRRFPNPPLSALIAGAAWTRFWQWGGTPPG